MTGRLLALAIVVAGVVAGSWGCATVHTIPGTLVEDTKLNRELLVVCEEYRRAMEEKDAGKLLALASHHYFEDSGTPKASDDYGYEGLKQVLVSRLSAVREVRFSIEYRHMAVAGNHAEIDIRYDASYQMATAMGDRWERKQSDKRFVLEKEEGKWLFTAGM